MSWPAQWGCRGRRPLGGPLAASSSPRGPPAQAPRPRSAWQPPRPLPTTTSVQTCAPTPPLLQHHLFSSAQTLYAASLLRR
eukprot:910550-Prorocentrum_minimum.AAC.1